MTFRSWKLFQVTKNSYQEWRLEVSWGRFWTFSNSLSAKNRPVLAELFSGCVQQWNCDQNTSEKTVTRLTKSQFTIHFTVSQFSSSVCCFVYIGMPKRRNKKVPTTRGVLHHVIIPFLYCDLFEASAQAKKHFQTFSFLFHLVQRTSKSEDHTTNLLNININIIN